ncbi:hypothetical protein OM269_21880 [Escherichia albertii]|nr:hypothetical protein [Escherichia albertii]
MPSPDAADSAAGASPVRHSVADALTVTAIQSVRLQDRIREINGWLGQEVIRFKNYSLDTDNG